MSYQTLLDAVIKGDIKTAKEETLKAVDAGQNAQDILDQGLIEAMNVVGDNFSKGAIFVPQMLRSAKTMQECVEVLKPHFQENAMTTKGNIVLGTVKGDLHDIGKNLVGMMLEGAGFNIIDLGVDVAPEVFVDKIKEGNLVAERMSPEAYMLGDLGKVYGYQWRNQHGVDQVQEILDGLKSNPYSRYHILDGWNKADFREMALPPCHLLYQFIVKPLTIEERWELFQKKLNFLLFVKLRRLLIFC